MFQDILGGICHKAQFFSVLWQKALSLAVALLQGWKDIWTLSPG